jgi:hypothetical protein
VTIECSACCQQITIGETALRVADGLLCETCQTAARRCTLSIGHWRSPPVRYNDQSRRVLVVLQQEGGRRS